MNRLCALLLGIILGAALGVLAGEAIARADGDHPETPGASTDGDHPAKGRPLDPQRS